MYIIKTSKFFRMHVDYMLKLSSRQLQVFPREYLPCLY